MFALETRNESVFDEKEFAFPIVFASRKIEDRETSAAKIVDFRRDGVFWRLIMRFIK